MTHRIELTFNAIDQMITVNGTSRPDQFGGGLWNAEEEYQIYKKQVNDKYNLTQWIIFTIYFEMKLKELLK